MATKPCENCGEEVRQRYASKYISDHWLCSECKENEVEPTEFKEMEKKLDEIIVTTTHTIQGKRIVKYIDIISAEIISGINILKDIGATFTDIFGGSARSYQNELDKMKDIAFLKLKEKAYDLGANAIIGIDLDYGELRGSMLMLVVNGTAVIAE